MGDFIELANSYYRLLRWVEAADVEKKNTALRSLDRIKRFLDESDVEVIDLTSQPFSEGWAVNVMKIDDSVPENELVFTKMVKPIIQIKGEIAQEGEVYVGKLDVDVTKNDKEADNKVNSVEAEDNQMVSAVEQNTEDNSWRKRIGSIKDWHLSAKQWTVAACSAVALLLIILVVCCLGGQSELHTEIAAVDKKIEELSSVDYRNQLGESSIVTVEIRNGENTIIVTQPIGESVNSTVELNGTPVTITTNNNALAEGE